MLQSVELSALCSKHYAKSFESRWKVESARASYLVSTDLFVAGRNLTLTAIIIATIANTTPIKSTFRFDS